MLHSMQIQLKVVDISYHYSIFCITDCVTMGTRKKEFRTKRDFSKKVIYNFNNSLKKMIGTI